jgi:release factor glutamine methyltransferase
VIGEAVAASTEALRAAGIDDPKLDAEVLLAEATGLGRAALTASAEAELAPEASRRFGEMVRRRLRREPVAYIVGRKGFRHIELTVDPRVLIPRPETELLVELALELRPATVLDVGTGSGAVALAVASELPQCAVVATDTSPAALEVARANAERLGLDGRVRLLEGTVPEREELDLILANLPYVAEPDWPSLQPEVTEWEPREALLAGPDGLDAIRTFLIECGRGMSRMPVQTSATLALEVGVGQAAMVATMVEEAGWGETEVRRDLAGIERVVVGRRG